MPSLPVALQNYIYGYQRLQLLPRHFQEEHNAWHRSSCWESGWWLITRAGTFQKWEVGFYFKKITLRVPVLPFHYTKDVRSIQLKYLNIFHIRKHAEKIIKLMLPVLLGNNRCFNPCCPRDENQKTLPLRTKVCSCAWSFFRERMCERIILKYFLLIY